MQRLHAIRFWCEQHAAILLFSISLVLVGAVAVRGVQLKMDKIVPYRLPHHMYPTAISMLYHHGSPYVMYVEIQDRMKPMRSYIRYDEIFTETLDEHTAFNNALLEETIRTPLQAPQNTRLVPGDDKGLIDIVIASLLLFGANVQGLYYTTVLILLLTVLAFFLAFRHRPEMCLIPLFTLSALFAAMPGFLLSQEMYSITNPRLFAILGMLPAIHLMLIPFDRGHFSWLRLAAAAFQTLVIVECIHVRSSTVWLVFLAVAVYLGVLGVRFFRRQAARVGSDQELMGVLKSGWGIGLLLCGICGLKLYQECVYDKAYAADLKHRVFWHNVGIGMALHPKFAQKYNLGINDNCMQVWVKSRVSPERAELIFGIPGEALNPGTVAKDHQAYEEECRRAVVGALLKYPWASVELFCYYKPRLALWTLAWAAGVCPCDEEGLYLETQRIALPDLDQVAQHNLHIRLLELGGFCLALLFGCVWFRIRPNVLICLNVLFALILLGSYLPSTIAYPLLPVIGDFLFCASVCVLGAAVTVLYVVTARYCLAERQATPAVSDPESRLAA